MGTRKLAGPVLLILFTAPIVTPSQPIPQDYVSPAIADRELVAPATQDDPGLSLEQGVMISPSVEAKSSTPSSGGISADSPSTSRKNSPVRVPGNIGDSGPSGYSISPAWDRRIDVPNFVEITLPSQHSPGPSAPAPAPTPAPARDGTVPGTLDCEGVRADAGNDIQALIDSHPTGTTFCLGSGIHRVAEPLRPRSKQRFVGAPGAVISGAIVLEGFKDSNGRFYADELTQGPTTIDWSASSLLYEQSVYSDDVFMDEELLQRVSSLSEVIPGKFFFDYEADRIWLGDDPTGRLVELAVSDGIFSGASDVAIEDLIIEKSRGIGVDAGRGYRIVNSELRLHAARGIHLIRYGAAINNFIHSNGQFGISGTGDYLVVEGNEISYNNSHRLYAGDGGNWSSGGTKFHRTGDPLLGSASGIALRGNYVHHNWGDGLWLDIDNIYAVVEDNVSSSNERQGIFYEISYQAILRNNTLTGNGHAGIRVSSSSDVEVYGNTVEDNGEGILLWQVKRGPGTYGDHVVANVNVHDNYIRMASGRTGAGRGGKVTENAIYSSGNRFERNHYTLGPEASLFWNDEKVGVNEWRSFGNDVYGTFN